MAHKKKKDKKIKKAHSTPARVRWDKYETALLIDAYRHIKEGYITKQEAIAALSNMLREHAVNQKVEIDDKYRNKNGIEMQLANIQQLMEDKAGARRHNAAVFIEMVDVFNNDQAQFETILADAYREYHASSLFVDGNELANTENNEIPSKHNSVFDYLNEQNFEYIDLRLKGGCLWVVGGPEVEGRLKPLKASGLAFHYKEGGGHATQGKNAWWTRDQIIDNSDRPETSAESSSATADNHTDSLLAKGILHNEIMSVLNSHFKYGFNIDSPIELIRFRDCCDNDGQMDLIGLDDDTLRNEIKVCGIEADGKIYVIDSVAKKKIDSFLRAGISGGKELFYYELFYEQNEEWLYEAHIYDDRLLKTVLMASFPQYYYRNQYFTTNSHSNNEMRLIRNEILRVWGEQILMSYSELRESLPFIPFDKIKCCLSYSDSFVWNSPETYTRRDSFKFSEEWIDSIVSFAMDKCNETGSVTFEQLPIDEISAENYELSETALYDLVFSQMKDCFSRNGRVIRLKESEPRNAVTMIQEFCRKHDTCTLEQLIEVMRNAEGVVRYPTIIEAANSVAVRVDENVFVNENRVHFNVLQIDKVLDGMVEDNAIGIRDITVFATFPECGVPWNLFVLESYCRRFSNTFRYDCITANSNNSGAIIRKASHLTYQDAMAELLAKSSIELTEQEAFDYLINSGLMIRRRYSEIDRLLDKATKIRKGWSNNVFV